MKGFKLRLVETEKDLKDVNMEFLLESYSIDDCTGVFYDDGEADFDPSGMDKAVVQICVVVHGRLFVENANVWMNEEGVFIEGEEFHSHF